MYRNDWGGRVKLHRSESLTGVEYRRGDKTLIAYAIRVRESIDRNASSRCPPSPVFSSKVCLFEAREFRQLRILRLLVEWDSKRKRRSSILNPIGRQPDGTHIAWIPAKIWSANCGLIDNKTFVCIGYVNEAPESFVGDFVEAPGRFLNDVVFFQGFEVWSFREGISE